MSDINGPELTPKFQRELHEYKRSKLILTFKEQTGIDIPNLEELEKVFRKGMEEGNVIFVPRRDGTGILNIVTDIDDNKIAKNIEIEDKNEASYLLGLQGEIESNKNKAG